MLTSTKNPRIRRIRKLQDNARTRKKEGVFVIEGIRLVEEALEAGVQPEAVFYAEDIGERGMEIVDEFRGRQIEVTRLAPHVMQAASDTETPQGILAILPLQSPSLPPTPNFVLILDGLRDPGNLGTILRTALAAGVDGVLLAPGAVDPFSPKVVRAAMGAHFRLAIQQMEWAEIFQFVDSQNLAVYLADAAGGQPYDKSGFSAPVALLIGGEAEGAGDQAQKLATCRVHIPMPGQAESLNAAVAASILMFEVVRQREGSVRGEQ